MSSGHCGAIRPRVSGVRLCCDNQATRQAGRRRDCKVLENTDIRRLCQCGFLDIIGTRKYNLRFLTGGPKSRRFGSGGVAQLGERLNGIQEVRGSIPLASMPRMPVPQSIHPDAVSGFAGIAQLVEHNLAKVGVAGSSPVSRFPVRPAPLR